MEAHIEDVTNNPPWGETANKVRWLLEQIFDPCWVGKKLQITVGERGISPRPGLKYVRIYKSPRFGTVPRDWEAIRSFIEQWRKELEPYLVHANAVHYKTSTKRGASKLYLYYDPNYEAEVVECSR